MLSLSCPLPQEVGAQPPRSGLRLKVGELSDVVSGALLSMLAMPNPQKDKSVQEPRSQTPGIAFPPRHPRRRTCVLLLGPPGGAPAAAIVASTTAKRQAAGNLSFRPRGQSCLRGETLAGRMGGTLWVGKTGHWD